MFLRSVVLGSPVIVAFASALQHLVDDADIKVRGATLEPISQCPATTSRTFHHDGLQKDKRAEATFHFDPPRDGCYLIEERTELDATQWMLFQSKECEASSNTKVHVHYCKGLQANGTVDQTPKGFARQPQDQWTFIAALQFYAGHPGNVTLSNEGTEPGTLTVFDQVRFSWSGKDCFESHAHPRRAEIRMTVDFQHIADRLTIFGIALKKRLAEMAGIPESSLRLTDLRSGSVIAEFLVLPGVVDDPLTPGLDVGSAVHSIELLRTAVSRNAVELCALTGGPLEGCNVELKDLGFATPSVKALPVTQAVPEQHTEQQQENDTQADGSADANTVIIVVSTVAAAGLLLFVLYRLYIARSVKAKIPSSKPYEIKVQSIEVSMPESNSEEEKEPVEQDDDKSTVCPSISDKQSEPALGGDVENVSTPEQGMSVVKVISKRSQRS
eukprot:gnl/MRDRNA2_/MRDRNA2_81113_c0_seq3.p1 gnl/MRDRNA2_/MRDRNA2_81113_c0~~gnl/MRDRNA2_/MRDRNA2_81113_c0_seq3.p1  ORF type:complete len:442 (+),score=101.83 gnl/MRDRNA2_/MRDRNA2_81113_c0_seq3:83-1408(+)